MKNSAYYIKTSILMVLLALESYFITQLLLNYIRSEDYFTPPIRVLGAIALSLLVLIYTYALTVGAWRKWEQYIVVPLPISLGIFVGIYFLNSTHAVLLFVVAFVLLSYDVFVATTIRDQLIKFNPVTILKFSTRGILFMFSILAAVFVFLHPTEKGSGFDLSGKIADLAQEQFSSMMQPEFDPASLPPDVINDLEGKGLPSFNLDLRDTVKTEVDNIITPYKQFIPPLIALMVFALIRFLGTIVHIAFNLTAPIVFAIAKKTSFLHSHFVPAEKEELSFTQPEKETPTPKPPA